MKRAMVRSAIRPRFHEESAHQVRSASGSDLMPWLCGTGILAGFDALLDFDDRAVTQWFEADLRRNWRPLHHRYIMAIGEKQCCDS